MIVRAARAEDAATLVASNAALARETEGRQLDHERLARGVAAVLADPSRGRYVLAEHEGRRLGCLLVTTEWSDWRAGWFWWIQSVYVQPEARRQGVYRALYDHVLRQAREAGDVCGVRLYVERGNTVARATYERLGMQHAHYDMYEVDFVLPPT